MIKRSFDPKKPLRYVRYGRMSSDEQNPRSPDQQLNNIDRELNRCGYCWTHVADFRDDGISGRYVKSRPQFMKMVSLIRSGKLQVDAILVDSYERFGRSEKVDAIRNELRIHHGVVVLTAETRFSDPTSTEGKMVDFVQEIRAKSANDIKAHDVLRGKLDAAQAKHWPGGDAPFGFRVEAVLGTRKGREVIDHYLLKPDPETRWIIARGYQAAYENGWGQTRVARYLNNDPDIPQKYKPFHESTVGYWLRNPIYCGILRWNDFCTDVVDDRKIEQRNPDDEVLWIEDYCEPIVSKDVWYAVRAMREARGEAMRRARDAKAAAAKNGKQIAPLVTGMSVNYPLAGLVRCGLCGRAMRPDAAPVYTTKDGDERSYVRYFCPASYDGTCSNVVRVPEEWLRTVVIERVVERLFLRDCEDGDRSN